MVVWIRNRPRLFTASKGFVWLTVIYSTILFGYRGVLKGIGMRERENRISTIVLISIRGNIVRMEVLWMCGISMGQTKAGIFEEPCTSRKCMVDQRGRPVQ